MIAEFLLHWFRGKQLATITLKGYRWVFALVLRFLMRHPSQPMNVCSLAVLTRKTVFLLTLAAAKRNSEVWAFSADVVFGHDKQSATLRFLPGFIAKTQKPDRPDTALSPVTIPALAPLRGQIYRRKRSALSEHFGIP